MGIETDLGAADAASPRFKNSIVFSLGYITSFFAPYWTRATNSSIGQGRRGDFLAVEVTQGSRDMRGNRKLDAFH
jgi:hypothetical protein